jgi:ABC-type transporter Mla MlaB component
MDVTDRPEGLAVVGEIDVNNIEELLAAIQRHGPRHVRLDLTGVRFVDLSSMARLLAVSRGRAGQAAPDVEIGDVSSPVARVVSILDRVDGGSPPATRAARRPHPGRVDAG